MQMKRLFQIVYYLLENGKSSAPELANKFEPSLPRYFSTTTATTHSKTSC